MRVNGEAENLLCPMAERLSNLLRTPNLIKLAIVLSDVDFQHTREQSEANAIVDAQRNSIIYLTSASRRAVPCCCCCAATARTRSVDLR